MSTGAGDNSAPGHSQSQERLGVDSEPTRTNKRKRSARATMAQMEALVGKIEAQPFLATKKFPGVLGRENYDHAWKEVAKDLNTIKNGAIKTADQWITVWRDIKSRVCTKAAKLNRERRATGNLAIETAPLTELEQRMISIVGTHYAVGSSCPDSMQEGREDTDMVQGNEEAVVEDIVGFFPPIEFIDTDNAEMESRDQPEPFAQPIDIQVINLPTTPASPVASTSRARVHPRRPASTPMQAQRSKNLNPRRTLYEQMSSARTDFLAVAEANSQSMKMLAEATKLNAEAAKAQGEAANVQAQASLLFAQAATKISDALLLLAQKK